MGLRYGPRGTELLKPGEVARPIFGIDIDGTLGYYHEHFHRFAEAWLGRTLPDPKEFGPGVSFSTHLGIAKSTYREIKLAYRRGGAKRSMPAIPGADALTKVLRDRGAVVVLCTTRPYLSLEGVDKDTRHWAKRNKIQHDFIIWGENKYRELARFGDRVVSVLEDEPPMMKQAMDAGLIVNGMMRPYNGRGPWGDDAFPGVNGYWFDSLKEAAHTMKRQLDKWEEERQ